HRVSPAATPAQTARHASEDDSLVLANTPQQQAVFHKRLNLLAIAFWQPGRVKFDGDHSLEVDRPCMLLLRDRKIAISNPQNQPGTIKITLDGTPFDVKLVDSDLDG